MMTGKFHSRLANFLQEPEEEKTFILATSNAGVQWALPVGTQASVSFFVSKAPLYNLDSVLQGNLDNITFNGPGEGFTLPSGKWSVLVYILSPSVVANVFLTMYYMENGTLLTTNLNSPLTSLQTNFNSLILQYTYISENARTHFIGEVAGNTLPNTSIITYNIQQL